jgi:hypothetical protein
VPQVVADLKRQAEGLIYKAAQIYVADFQEEDAVSEGFQPFDAW